MRWRWEPSQEEATDDGEGEDCQVGIDESQDQSQ